MLSEARSQRQGGIFGFLTIPWVSRGFQRSTDGPLPRGPSTPRPSAPRAHMTAPDVARAGLPAGRLTALELTFRPDSPRSPSYSGLRLYTGTGPRPRGSSAAGRSRLETEFPEEAGGEEALVRRVTRLYFKDKSTYSVAAPVAGTQQRSRTAQRPRTAPSKGSAATPPGK